MKCAYLSTFFFFPLLAAFDSSIDLRHLEPEGIGFNHGYTTLESYNMQAFEASCLLLDVRGHFFDNNKWAANAGLGQRFGLKERYAIGYNLFYDFRKIQALSIQQAGLGLEFLGSKARVTINGSYPFSHTFDVVKTEFASFSGHGAIVNKKITTALPFTEIGFSFPCGPYVDLSLGSYYLWEKEIQSLSMGQAIGGKFGLQIQCGPYVRLQGNMSQDRIFGLRGSGTLAIHIPLGRREKKDSSPQKVLTSLFQQPILRPEIIPIQKKVIRQLLTYNSSSLLSFPRFVFVKNNSTSVGDGSFEFPFVSLEEAEKNSLPGDIIYVFPGDRTSRGLEEGIQLKNKQLLTSSALSLKIQDVIIPALTPQNKPVITDLHYRKAVKESGTSHYNKEGFSDVDLEHIQGDSMERYTEVHFPISSIDYFWSNFSDTADSDSLPLSTPTHLPASTIEQEDSFVIYIPSDNSDTDHSDADSTLPESDPE